MSEADREKWDKKYEQGQHASSEPSCLLTALDGMLPVSGRAIDVAGGAGRHACWMANRGLDVTLLDISAVALDLATSRAESAGVTIHPLCLDLERDPFPPGPWDVILTFHFLQRTLFDHFRASLAPGGLLICVQPTVRNLERHPRPPDPFLLNEQELLGIVHPLQVEHYREGWLEEDRHEALIVARRTP